MSDSPDRDDPRPIDPVRSFREAIDAGDLDAKNVLSSMAEKGVLEPGVLTRLGGGRRDR